MTNIIYLHAHDMGRVNSIYGHAAAMPHLQAFAAESMVFRQAFCAAPTCSPSRAALLTGRTPHECGVTGLIHRGFRLRDPRQHLAAHLRAHGYETALFGIQHELPAGESGQMYDITGSARDRDPYHLDQKTAAAAAAYLAAPKRKPFFLSVGLFAPHRPFAKAAPSASEPLKLPYLPDTPEVRRDLADYQASVAWADRAMGKVLGALFAANLHRNSLIIVTTDHGVAFPGAKCLLKDSGIGVTLLMRAPGSACGAISDSLVSHLDIFPTCCDFAGLPHPADLRGASLRPVLTQDQASIRNHLFAEVTFHASYEPMRCVRTARHKFIRFFDEDRRARLANIDDGPAKTDLLSRALLPPRHAETELYDLELDPDETQNLAHRSDLADLHRKLDEKLHRWMRETNDPLLYGRVKRPPGARINRTECRSGAEQNFEPEEIPSQASLRAI